MTASQIPEDVATDHELATTVDIAATVQAEVEELFAQRGRSPNSPEARRETAVRIDEEHRRRRLNKVVARVRPGTRPFEVAKRVLTGAYFDGFIHAGNFAYMSLIALFPFFITATALMSAFGRTSEGVHALQVVLDTMPDSVAQTLEKPVRDVLAGRSGLFLWLGAAVGFWTVGSLIETIRDILRRAYGTVARKSFFTYRLYAIGITVAAVMLLLVSFSLQVVTVALDAAISRILPDQFEGWGTLALSRGLSAGGLFFSLYLIFYSLTPSVYRSRRYPKWPGALVTTLWWVGVTLALPPLLASILNYDSTYGSLAGVMVALFFFYLIGLGVVVGAELNAALAETPEETQNRIGQGDERARQKATLEGSK